MLSPNVNVIGDMVVPSYFQPLYSGANIASRFNTFKTLFWYGFITVLFHSSKAFSLLHHSDYVNEGKDVFPVTTARKALSLYEQTERSIPV